MVRAISGFYTQVRYISDVLSLQRGIWQRTEALCLRCRRNEVPIPMMAWPGTNALEQPCIENGWAVEPCKISHHDESMGGVANSALSNPSHHESTSPLQFPLFVTFSLLVHATTQASTASRIKRMCSWQI